MHLLPRVGAARDQPRVAVEEHLHRRSGRAEAVRETDQTGDPVGGDVVGPPCRSDARRVPLRAHQALPLEPAQRPVHRPGVALAVVHRAQPYREVVTVVRLFHEKQQQARLEEVSRLKLGHEPSQVIERHPDTAMLPLS